MQDERRIAAKKAGRVDPQRKIAVDAGFDARAPQNSRRHGRPSRFSSEHDPEKWKPVVRPDHARCNWRPFRQPPAMRRDHHPLRLGLSVCSPSPTSVMTGCGAGAEGCGGCTDETASVSLVTIGAGSRTVERRRGSDGTAGSAGAGGAAENGGAESRSATASRKLGSVARGAVSSCAVACSCCDSKPSRS